MSERTRLEPSLYLRFAVRNLLRNTRRTLITLAAFVIALAGLTLLSAINDGWLREMQNNFILSMTGHIQVHAQGFEDFQNLSLRIEDPAEVTRWLQEEPDLFGWTERVRTPGLATNEGRSSGIQILAVEPEQETWVTDLSEALREGRWLEPGSSRDLLLGDTVAANLKARVGDPVVLTVQKTGGELTAEVFYVRGILHAGSPQIDRTLAVINLYEAQKWLGLGSAITDLVLRTNEHSDYPGIYRLLKERLPADRYEVMSWEELDPMVGQWLRFSQAYGIVVIFIVVSLVLVQTLNTMLMALHERRHELHTMVAIGTSRAQLFGMLLLESVLLIGLGSLLGYLLGYLLVVYLDGAGIDLTRFANAFKFFYMNPVIYPEITPTSAARLLGATLITALLAGIYPAWKASLTRPDHWKK
jgi:ABC-type lipoprotein release transport system permease subunit